MSIKSKGCAPVVCSVALGFYAVLVDGRYFSFLPSAREW